MQISSHPVGSQCPRRTGAKLGDLQEKRQYDWEDGKIEELVKAYQFGQ